jgi:hypothetical protein
VVARFAPSATSSETTRIWLFAPVVVRAEAEVKEERYQVQGFIDNCDEVIELKWQCQQNQ